MFSKHQYCFRPKHSTEHAALQFHDYIMHQLYARHTLFSIYIDRSKALCNYYDLNIVHSVLFSKFKYYNITNISCHLIFNYLSSRTYCILFNATKPDFAYTSIGVPQGSILGPILFLVYIDDLPYFTKVLDVLVCADYTTVYASKEDFASSSLDSEVNDLTK